MASLLDPVALVGRVTMRVCVPAGRFMLFVLRSMAALRGSQLYWRQFIDSLISIGYFSLPMVALTALFTGMVLALQSYVGFAKLSNQGAIANLVVLSMTRELGPVLAGLMVAGRIGAAIAAEIGTMRVTDQIDALTTLSTNPIRYLVVPRALAGIIALPFLVIVADILGVLGGFLTSVIRLDLNADQYLRDTLDFLNTSDVVSGLVKAALFGAITVMFGCYQGYYSKGGAQGVGRATTDAVVGASIFIFVFDYIITDLFFTR